MPRYYSKLENRSTLDIRGGTAADISAEFSGLSSILIRRCSYIQSQIQKVIYSSHGPELVAVKKALSKFPNPKARMEFLSSFPYKEADPVISTVFSHAQKLFLDIYKLRNILAHETWNSSGDYKGVVLFSELEEEAKLKMASSRLLHDDETTPFQVYDATIRYIRSVKIVSADDLRDALGDADLCAWILMQISHLLDEKSPTKKEEIKQAFFVFIGTSHLFDGAMPLSKKVQVQSSKRKTIRSDLKLD